MQAWKKARDIYDNEFDSTFTQECTKGTFTIDGQKYEYEFLEEAHGVPAHEEDYRTVCLVKTTIGDVEHRDYLAFGDMPPEIEVIHRENYVPTPTPVKIYQK